MRLIDANRLKTVIDLNLPLASVINEIVDMQPTADAVRVVHAHWNKDADGRRCSNCKCLYWDKSVPVTAYPYAYYCPHCGAKMDADGASK